MSRVGRMPIDKPSSVTVTIEPTRIEVNINSQRKPKYVEISDGVLSNWTLSFKTTRIRTIGIRILERDPGKAQPGIMGFSEVELRFDR